MSDLSYLYLVWPEHENALNLELKLTGSSVTAHSFGFQLDSAWPPPPAAFCRQLLAAPTTHTGDSIKSLAEKLLELLPEEIPNWQFHSYSLMEKGGGRRAQLVSETLIELLKKKRRQ